MSCWNGAISEVVEVVLHTVHVSVCGQCGTISKEKYCIVLVALPGRKLAACMAPGCVRAMHRAGFILSHR